MKYLFATLVFALSIHFASAQKAELTVKSSIICEMCKETIEDGLAYVDGIKSARVDVDNNEIYVKYKPKVISEREVKAKINSLGYVAGDMKPSQAQFDTLHDCCKKEGAACD